MLDFQFCLYFLENPSKDQIGTFGFLVLSKPISEKFEHFLYSDIVFTVSCLIDTDSMEILNFCGKTHLSVQQKDFQKNSVISSMFMLPNDPRSISFFYVNAWVRLPLCCCYYCLEIHWKLLIKRHFFEFIFWGLFL